MGEPSVSVCVPASKERYLRAAIDSALAQTHDDLEVVVTDDSGTLETAALATGDPRVRYFRNPRRLGMGGNSSESVRRSRGRLICFLHDDDELLPGYLEATVPWFAGDASLGVVFTDCELTGDVPDGARRIRGAAVPAGRHEHFLATIVEHDPILPSLAVIRRETWERGEDEHPLPPITTADTAIWIRAALQGWAFRYVKEPLVRYRVHDAQLSADEKTLRDNIVWLWERYSFDDARAETLRREALANALINRAGTLVQRGQAADARADLNRARELAPNVRARQRQGLRALAVHPRTAPAAQVVRRVVRRVLRRSHPEAT